MLDLLTADGSSAEDLLPTGNAMDGMGMLHSYSFTQQLLMPQGLEGLGQHAPGLHSPGQGSLGGGLDERGGSDAVAGFFSQPVGGGLVHSRSMTRLVPTPAPANNANLLASSAQHALPTSSRALAPPGLNSSSLPGSPRAMPPGSPSNKAPSSSTNSGEQLDDDATAEDMAEVSPEPRLPPPGAASKATSTASDLLPAHYQGPSSGTVASSKLLTLLSAGTAQASREQATAAAAPAVAGTGAAGSGGGAAAAPAAAAGGKRSGSTTPAAGGAAGGASSSQHKEGGSSSARAAAAALAGRGAIFPSGAELLGDDADLASATDPLSQILEQALLQDSKQQAQQQQRAKQAAAKPQPHSLDYLYDNMLLPPASGSSGGVARQASKPPKPASQAFQRLTAGLSGDWGSSDRQQQQSQQQDGMDWSDEPAMYALGAAELLLGRASSDSKSRQQQQQEDLNAGKRSQRKRVSAACWTLGVLLWVGVVRASCLGKESMSQDSAAACRKLQLFACITQSNRSYK